MSVKFLEDLHDELLGVHVGVIAVLDPLRKFVGRAQKVTSDPP